MTGTATTRPSPPAAELLSLLERLIGVTERALEALRGGELSELPPLVARREEILSLTAPLLHELRLARTRSGGASPPGAAAALAEVADAGRRLEALEHRLVAELDERRAELAGALRESGRAAAARAAYSRFPSPSAPAR